MRYMTEFRQSSYRLHLQSIRNFIASFRVLRQPNYAKAENPAEAVFREIAWSVAGKLDSVGRGTWVLEHPWVSLSFPNATRALLETRDPDVAIALAAIAANHQRHRIDDSSTIRHLKRWFDHPVPEVGAVAVLLLAGRRKNDPESLKHLATYIDRPDRVFASGMLLRSFLSI